MSDVALSRLEAVTSRLEALESKLASSSIQGYQSSRAVPAGQYGGAPLSSAPSRGGADAPPSGGGPVKGLEQILSEYVQPLVATAAQLNPNVQKATAIVQKAFEELTTVVAISLLARKPDQGEFNTLLQKLSEQLNAATNLTDGRRTDEFNHYKTIAEALQAMCFVLYTGPSCGMAAPTEHVAQSWQTAEFYANKVSVAHRNSNPLQLEWVKQLKACMMQLKMFVQMEFPTGLSWKAGGLSVDEAVKAVKSGGGSATPTPTPAVAPTAAPEPVAPAPATAPESEAEKPAPAATPGSAGRTAPPPPPPPNRDEFLAKVAAGAKPAAVAGGSGGLSDVFASLNQGEAVTSGLKKVTDDMKAKNRADRTGVVSAGAIPAPAKKIASKTKGGPPKLQLEAASRKWVVEHHEGNKEIVISEVNPQQTVYVYDCHDCVIQVQGKVNSVAVDGCSKTGVVLTDVVAQVEAVNCNSIQIQCTGAVPTISVEKVDGCQLFVSEAASKNPDFQVVTAKTSAMNIVVVEVDEEAEPVEQPIPEQFISKFKDGKLYTVAASHAGA